jgi:Nuclease subunit of the excinuclease complex
MKYTWSKWRPFPDPRKAELLTAPIGPGCYELRRRAQFILFGMGNNVAARMSSLLPHPHGSGTRRNAEKREYVLRHIAEIEYRTLACSSSAEAADIERELKRSQTAYHFGT